MREALAAAAVAQEHPRRKRRRSSSSSRGSSGGRRRSRSLSRKKKKKVKKKKKSHRGRRGDSRKSSSSDQTSSSSSLVPPLQRKANKDPGSVLKMLLANVADALSEAAVREDAGRVELGQRGNLLASYFQIVARPQMRGKIRDLRELETLARCVDLLKQGLLAELGDGSGREIHGRGVSSPDEQLARRAAPRGGADAPRRSGSPRHHAPCATPHAPGGESHRPNPVAPERGRVERPTPSGEARARHERKRRPEEGERAAGRKAEEKAAVRKEGPSAGAGK